MRDLTKLEKISRWVLLISLLAWIIAAWFKDAFPAPNFYDQTLLNPPVQTETESQPFIVSLESQSYEITPLFYYALNGVVVSSSSANDFTDIWHRKRWKDYINTRDLCVIWGDNVSSGVYQKLHFSSDSWTCWVDWHDDQAGKLFHNDQLSNNHLLTNFAWLQDKLKDAELGDQIQLTGYLVKYSNPANKYQRGTSISRTDTGNGACETVFLNNFITVKKANFGWRLLYSIAKWMSILSFIAVVVLMFIAPHEKYHKYSQP